MRHFVPHGFFMLLAVLALSACSGTVEESRPQLDKQDRDRLESGSILGEGGLTFLLGGGSRNDAQDSGGGVAVNGYLWRASLDTLSFMPLVQTDPFGGVIITDWYSSEETPEERFKVTAYILTRSLRSDGIRVSVFKQKRRIDGGWQDADVDGRVARQLENAILTRARQMRISFELQPEE